ncbi:phosphoribosylanthranilate isomerase [Sessilibacter sp. MAH2]
MSANPRVKICGLTNVEDALSAVELGADAIGLVFYPKSPRFVDLNTAREIALKVGPFTTVVGLFVDASVDVINSTLEKVPLHLLQFHGDETPEYCAQFSRPYIKAFRMAPGLEVEALMDKYTGASGFLLDAYKPGVPGGTGQSFEWQRFPRYCKYPLILAGGLNPDNVSGALASTEAYAVDVSGGVESSPGQKDVTKMMSFINSVKHPPWR